MSNRTSTDIETSYIIMRGLITKGLTFHGPFATEKEAEEYSGKNFVGDSVAILTMNKETHTHER